MGPIGRRVIQALCVVGIVACLGLAAQTAFVRSEYVGDTRCYPTLWQRNGRAVCADSNRRRDIVVVAAVAGAVGLTGAARALRRGASSDDGPMRPTDERAPVRSG